MEVCGVGFAADFAMGNLEKSEKKRDHQKRILNEREESTAITQKDHRTPVSTSEYTRENSPMDGKTIRSHNPVEAALETNRKGGILWKGQFALGERYEPMILCRQQKNRQNSEEVRLNPLAQAEG